MPSKRRVTWWTAALFVHAGALVIVTAWILADPVFPREQFRQPIDFGFLRGGKWPPPLMWSPPGVRPLLFKLWAATAILSGAAILLGLFVGPIRQRGVRSWLVVLTLCGCWLALGTSWPHVAWFGKRFRVAGGISQLERVAAELRSAWPSEDGVLPTIGPFQAYPLGKPLVIVLLSPSDRPLGRVQFTSVERSDEGGLRFRLSGPERGDWLEWHPPCGAPATFQGGLGKYHRLLRYSSIADGWYLARYRDHQYE